jgi:hypothetical protein
MSLSATPLPRSALRPRGLPVLLLLVAVGAFLSLSWPAVASAAAGDDWRRAKLVCSNLRAKPPAKPVVLLFGGSAARECTHSDSRWAAQVKRRGGLDVLTYNLGSTNQSFDHNLFLVEQLPEAPIVVVIGITYGRFTAPSNPSFSTALEPTTSYTQHLYSKTRILSPSRKRQAVDTWLKNRYPVFKSQYAYNFGRLRELVQFCLDKGMHPVLLDLPRNMPIIKKRLDAPMLRWRADCKALAAEHGIPWVNFVGPAKLVNTDFYDLVHLVEPGRTKWQKLLSDRTIAELRRQGLGSTAAQ